jgi:hypothetical protein
MSAAPTYGYPQQVTSLLESQRRGNLEPGQPIRTTTQSSLVLEPNSRRGERGTEHIHRELGGSCRTGSPPRSTTSPAGPMPYMPRVGRVPHRAGVSRRGLINLVLRETADTAIRSNAGHTRIRRLSRLAHTTLSRLTGADRRILGLWAGAHLGLAVLAWMASWINGQRGIYNALLGTYGQWDYAWYQNIAAHGYFSGQSFGSAERVFLPGDPAALVAVHLFVRDWVIAGLLVSLVAGGVALVCIGRLGGERAALYMLTAPAAMYLIVGYSESLFLALALPAWMAAKRRNWPLAALLAALAGLVRVNGLFRGHIRTRPAVTRHRMDFRRPHRACRVRGVPVDRNQVMGCVARRQQERLGPALRRYRAVTPQHMEHGIRPQPATRAGRDVPTRNRVHGSRCRAHDPAPVAQRMA